MLVKFHSSESGEILMFADSARILLHLLGKECTARGVITLEQLPEALAKLQTAMTRAKGEKATGSDKDTEIPVSFVQRAIPFLDLLQRTRKDKGYLLWEAAADFGQ